MALMIRSALLTLFVLSLFSATSAEAKPALQKADHIENPSFFKGGAKKHRASWEKLGERIVNRKLDRDTIFVTALEGRFKSIKLVVNGSALELYDIVIHFGDGSTYSPKTRLIFSKDTTSRTIDLPGRKRVIKKVVFKYGNLPGGGRATLKLFGK